MIAMATKQPEFDIDFGDELPDWDGFPLFWLAKRWHTTTQHLFNLIDTKQIKCPVDLRNKASSRAMIRVPRKSVIAFLNSRKDTEAVANSNPKPKARKFK